MRKCSMQITSKASEVIWILHWRLEIVRSDNQHSGKNLHDFKGDKFIEL